MLMSSTMASFRIKGPGLTRLILAIGFSFVFSFQPLAAEAQPTPTPTPTPKPTPVQMTVKSVQTYTKTEGEAGMGEWIVVEVNGLPAAVEKDGLNPRSFVLYLNGRPLQGVTALPIESNKLAFQLKRTDESRDAWSTLLGRPSFQNHVRPVTVSVGEPGKQSVAFENPAKPSQMNLRVYHPWWAIGSLVVLVLLVIFFIYKAKTSNIIRDSNPPQPPAGEKKPYSLALTQAAWWFFLVIGSFIFIYLITGDYNTITEQALVLMGIGIGTALGASMIDATKRDTSGNELSALRPRQAALAAEVAALRAKEAELTARIGAAAAPNPGDQQALRDTQVALSEKQTTLEETTKKIQEAEAGLSSPVSENFKNDLFTDANGLSLHRFQMAIWTVVLGVLFLIGVYKELAMPEFSTTMLALMGISAGTYLGFKIPEKQTKP
jgi:hypothetical protein